MENKITQYLNSLDKKALTKLNALRKILKEEFKDCTEEASYGVLALKDSKHFIYYGAFKKHLSIFPPLTINKELIKKTKNYRNEKGNLIFSYDHEIPYDLILEVAKALKKQYGSKS